MAYQSKRTLQVEDGYTLIELVVTLVIIGLLSALALPSFLNQVAKSREAEAKSYVGSLNRAQQAFYLEKQTFTSNISLLGLGLLTQTINYHYEANRVDEVQVANTAYPEFPETLRAYTGGVGATFNTDLVKEATTLTVLCQSLKPQAGSPGAIDFNEDAAPTCNGTFEPLN